MTIHFKAAEFDKAIWEQNKIKPEEIAKSLVRQNTLLGLTRNQVEAMLGRGSEEIGDINTDRGSITYYVQNNWTLLVIFQKDKVVEAKLRQPFLGI